MFVTPLSFYHAILIHNFQNNSVLSGGINKFLKIKNGQSEVISKRHQYSQEGIVLRLLLFILQQMNFENVCTIMYSVPERFITV